MRQNAILSESSVSCWDGLASDCEALDCASDDGSGVRVVLGVLVANGKAVGNSPCGSKVGVWEGWTSTVGVEVGSTVASGSSGTGVGTMSLPHAASKMAKPTPAIAVRSSRFICLVARIFFNTGWSISGPAEWPGRLSYLQ